MNLKKRNFEKMDYRKCRSIIGTVFEGERTKRFDADPVNRNRKAARLRRLYHRCADWICPKSEDGGWQACIRCKWLRSCKTAGRKWLMDTWYNEVAMA